MIGRVLELLVGLILLFFVWSQVILPAFRGHPLFPVFDTARRRARRALAEAHELELQTQLNIEAEQIKARTAQEAMRSDQEISNTYDGLIEKQERRQ
jgi:hypothetical protein